MADCSRAALELLASDNPPVFAVGLPWAAPDGRGPWTLGAGFEGFAEQVSAQLDRLTRLYAQHGLSADTPESYDPYEGWVGPRSLHLVQRNFLCRIHCRPDLLPDFLARSAESLPNGIAWADFGSGCCWAAYDTLDTAQWNLLTGTAARCQGHALLVKAGGEFKNNHDVFGPPRTDWAVMHRIKDVLDPRHVFCPGRMPGRV